MERYLAHLVIDSDGREYPQSVLTLPGDGSYSISPFGAETAATVFLNGVLTIGDRSYDSYPRIRQLSDEPKVFFCNLAKKS